MPETTPDTASAPERDIEEDIEARIVAPLVRDLVEWVAKEPRAYAEVMEAWHTNCPRLTVWESACDRGFVERTSAAIIVLLLVLLVMNGLAIYLRNKFEKTW